MAARNCIRKIVDVNLSKRAVYRMCREQKILPQHYRAFWRFAARAEILSRDFGNRIVFLENYRRVIDAILAAVPRWDDDVA
jgi:hypothetical protein